MRELTLAEIHQPSGGIIGVMALAALTGHAVLQILGNVGVQQAAESVASTVLIQSTTCEGQLQQYINLYGPLPTTASHPSTATTTAAPSA